MTLFNKCCMDMLIDISYYFNAIKSVMKTVQKISNNLIAEHICAL